MAVGETAEKQRKPYAAPVLRVYGSIEALTRSNSHLGGTHADVRGASHDIRTH